MLFGKRMTPIIRASLNVSCNNAIVSRDEWQVAPSSWHHMSSRSIPSIWGTKNWVMFVYQSTTPKMAAHDLNFPLLTCLLKLCKATFFACASHYGSSDTIASAGRNCSRKVYDKPTIIQALKEEIRLWNPATIIIVIIIERGRKCKAGRALHLSWSKSLSNQSNLKTPAPQYQPITERRKKVKDKAFYM